MAKRSLTALGLMVILGAASAQQYQPIQPILPFAPPPQTSAPRTYTGIDGSTVTIREIPRSSWSQPRSFSVLEIPGHGLDVHRGLGSSSTGFFTEPDIYEPSGSSWGWNQ